MRNFTFALFAALLLTFSLAACGDDTPIIDGGGDDGNGGGGGDAVQNQQGLVSVQSTSSADATASSLTDALAAADPVSVVANINHAANAPDSLMLRPTRVIVFGNPALGTPLMQAERTTGLDLPQKMLVYEDADGEVFVTYNSPQYLDARHTLPGSVDEQLTTIGNALANFATSAAGNEVDSSAFSAGAVSAGEGLVIDTSGADFETTYSQLRSAITSADPLTLIDSLDHAANAETVGLELPPTRLLIFGNPALGTPLMQAEQSLGIDLPQKMLVWEEDGDVFVAYNDPFYLAERHGLDTNDDSINSILTTIQGALGNLSAAATASGDDDSDDDN